jgi:hypothetical protein
MGYLSNLPPLVVGLSLTGIGIVKFYGLSRGIEGGADKPFRQRLCGA